MPTLDEGQVALPTAPITVVDDAMAQPALPLQMPPPGAFYTNMVDQISPTVLGELGSELVESINGDENAREEFVLKFKAAIEATNKHGGVNPDEGQQTGLVKHVLLNEARTHAHARLMQEMNCPPYQQKFKVVGSGTPETRALQDRLSEFSNYQLNNVIEGWNDTISRHFTHLCLVGTSYLKVCWDDRIGAPMVQQISAEKLILSPDTVDLRTSKRYTHQYEMSLNEYNQFVRAGYFSYDPSIQLEAGSESDQSTESEVSGIHIPGTGDVDSDSAKRTLVFYDVYTTAKFDGFHEFNDDGPDVESPYIITVEKSSMKVVRIVPNWNADDPIVRKPIQNIIMFKYLDGVGPTGEGIYDLIGGLDKAATSALRANLDAAAKSLNRPMFVGGGVKGGRIAPRPGELIKARKGEKVKDNFFELPVMPPDQTMLALLTNMSDEARRITMTTDFQVGDAAKANMPVGTVTALIAQGQMALTGIHQRVHAKMAEVFKQLMRLNFLYQLEQWEFTHTGRNIVMFREDFNPNTVDVIPASDPNVASQTMRMAQMQDVYALSQASPDMFNQRAVMERLLQVNKIPDWEELLVQPEDPPYLDPVSENMRAMRGEPIMAYDEQSHEGHIKVHMAFFQDPSLADNAFGEQAKLVLYEHTIDHITKYYRDKISSAVGMPITGEPVDPQTEAMITMRVSEAVTQSPLIAELQDVMAVGMDPAVETARQMAQLEMEIKQMEAVQDRNIKQQKALDDANERRAKLQQTLQELQIKAEAKNSADQQNTVLKIENMRQSHNEQTRIEVAEARQEMAQEHEKHVQGLQQEWEAHRLEMEAEREKLSLEIEALKRKNAEQAKQGWFSKKSGGSNDS